MSLNYERTIEVHGIQIPDDPHLISKRMRHTMEKGRYEIGECRRMAELVRRGDTVLELGAGVGLVSAVAAQKAGAQNVTCVEANPGLIPLIRETHRINGVEAITLLSGVAISRDDGVAVPFYLRPDFWASSMEPGGEAERVMVPKVPIARLIEEKRPDVLSMDIEGAEEALIAGLDLSSCRVVMMELHAKVYGHDGTARIFDAMHAQGFTYDAKNSRGGTVVVFTRFRAAKQTRVCAITCMKNEAPFIMEWVAYHRAIGITDFLIFTNDCDDATVAILDRLDELGVVRHLPNITTTIDSPRHQPYALAYARGHRQVRDADWIISMDVDEFINIHAGDGTMDALFSACDEANVISLSHLDFGCGGQETYEPQFVTERFTRCAPKVSDPVERRGIKTLIHRSAPAFRLSNHRPHMEDGDDPALKWVNGSGRGLGRRFSRGVAKGFPAKRCYRLAQMNHYPVRSMETYLTKAAKGNVVAIEAYVGKEYWAKRDRNESEDRSILPRLDRARTEYDRLLRDATLARLQAEAEADHQARIAELRNDPEKAALLEDIRADTAARMEAQDVAAE